MEWKITYVGSAEDDRYDQVLDSVLVGPVAPGPYRFVFQSDPPNWRDIPQDDILGVTVLLLTCAYAGQEFIRVGYYVNNEYGEEGLRENPPAVVAVDRVVRNILADKPRVTRFAVDFGDGVAGGGDGAAGGDGAGNGEGGLAFDGVTPEGTADMEGHAAMGGDDKTPDFYGASNGDLLGDAMAMAV